MYQGQVNPKRAGVADLKGCTRPGESAARIVAKKTADDEDRVKAQLAACIAAAKAERAKAPVRFPAAWLQRGEN